MKNLLYQSIGFYLNTLTRIAPKKGGRSGFKFFCTPQRGKIKKSHLEFFRTADQHGFDFNGIPITVYHWGNGPKRVLFVHGWQSHSYRWKKYIESLPPDEYTLIAYDAPGHGQSGGNQFTFPLNSYLIAVLAERYQGFDTVVAHSIGSISVLYALSHYGIENIGKVVAMASPSTAAEFFAFYIETLGLNSRTIRYITNEFQIYLKTEIEKVRLPAYAGKVTVPGLIIHDKDDPETPYKNAVELLESWKNASLVTTSGLGHNLRSQAVVQLVRDYILGNQIAEESLLELNRHSFVTQ